MTRARSTWTKPQARQAAVERRADIYTMNQEHPQPSVTEYESGDPDKWAETPTTNKNVTGDYDGDHVRRNEIGLGEMRADTFSHKDSDKWNGGGKYDNQKQAAERKASLAEQVARATLRTSDEKLIEAQATDLMALPAKALVATVQRLEKTSPAALNKEAKYRRALACCKLSANILGGNATEDQVERLATVMMSIDDPTLKQILKISAEVRVAEEAEAEDEGETAGAKCGEEAEEEEEGLSAADKKKLEEMEGEAACCQAGPSDLTQMFERPAQAPQAPPAPPAPAASDEISFEEEEEEEGEVAGDEAELAALFEGEELDAARKMQASDEEQLTRGNFSPVARTASSKGAKKLGAVTRQPVSADDEELSMLWKD